MGLDYSSDGQYNRSLMVAHDIVFYVEDVGKESDYEKVFEKLFSIKTNQFSVFGLGNKDSVIEAYKMNLTIKIKKTFLYIVDGDFDIVTNNFQISNDNFLYLDRYNIENYLLDEDAIVNYFRTAQSIEYEKAKTIIRFDNWYGDTCKKLSKLFYYYLYIHCLKLEKPPITVKCGSHQFFDYHTGNVSDEVIEKKIEELKKYIETEGYHYNESFNDFDSLYHDKFFNRYKYYICGKYLLHGLYLYLASVCKSNNLRNRIKEDDMKKWLIERINVNCLTVITCKFSRYISKI